MKKIIAIIMILATVFSLAACGESTYPAVESTEEEKTVMLTYKYENQTYEVRYELYRALFLNFAEEYDNGDRSFWSTADASDAIGEINERITDYCLDIFAVIHLSKKIGYDPYSKDADSRIEEYIRQSVDGNGAELEGFGGDYNAYLESLKKINMNYSVQVLLLRYSLAYDKILDHYSGTFNENNPSQIDMGALEYTEEDVREFYESDNCVRVSLVEINSQYISREKAELRRNEIAAKTTEEQALKYAVQFTAGDASDIMNGIVIGKNSLDRAYYSNVVDTAFGLAPYETSEIIDITVDGTPYYWILYKREKSEDYFDAHYDDIASVFVSESIGNIINNMKSEIKKQEITSYNLKEIDYTAIAMP